QALRRASSFPGLEALSSIDKAGRYLGPTMESNWVLPGRLLVGAYPASMNDSHHAHLLCTILLQGVSTFVCLQQEYRAEGVTEEMWRSGDALRPYFQDVVQLLAKLGELRSADPRSVPAICAPEETDFVHFPIVDCNVADDTKVLQLAAQLAGRLARGEVMYLHCWGGHGRTGTVVCIMLHLMYGLGADEAMERCQHVHDVRRIPISVGSPQTESQRQQVRRVIGRVIAHRRSLVPSPPAAAAATSPAPKQHQHQHKRESSPSNGGGGGGGISGAVLSPESSRKKEARGGGTTAASASTTVGGRRAWVRGRRQAFAQAPNGVGEDVSGWLDDDNEVEGDGLSDLQGGKKLKAGAGQTSAHRHHHHRMQSTVSSDSLSSSVGVAAATAAAAAASSSSSMPRRKSFTEPYSKDDPSRGTRMSRARRKSAPGKPPADVLAARAAAAAAAAADAASSSSSGKEDNDDDSMKSLLLLSPAKGINCRQTPSNAACSTPGDDAAAAASPGSCTGVERCVTRSSGGGGTSCRAR
ncbi:unnamed protein product, partial [Ectocarpus sp. 12 AP-2014]